MMLEAHDMWTILRNEEVKIWKSRSTPNSVLMLHILSILATNPLLCKSYTNLLQHTVIGFSFSTRAHLLYKNLPFYGLK